MKIFLLLATVAGALFVTSSLKGQILNTNNDYVGSWENSSSWVGGIQPDPLTTGVRDEANIYGYITRNGSLSFANIGANTKYFTIYDTLVVQGSMTFENNSLNLRIATGGLLVVFGDFTANNKVTLDNGGILAITGDLTLTGGQNDYQDNGGGLFVDGTISGNGDTAPADAIDQPTSSLNGSPDEGEQDLFDFINNGGEIPLPITLSYFEGEASENQIHLRWETLTEENFDFFEIQRSVNGIDFEVIATVKGNGFSADSNQYTFTDNSPALGWNYYRLNAIDFDGSSEIFLVIKVEYKPDFSGMSVFPNPGMGESLQVIVPSHFSGFPVKMSITDMKGIVVFQQEIPAMESKILFNNKLKPGIYLFSINAGIYSSTIRLLVN